MRACTCAPPVQKIASPPAPLPARHTTRNWDASADQEPAHAPAPTLHLTRNSRARLRQWPTPGVAPAETRAPTRVSPERKLAPAPPHYLTRNSRACLCPRPRPRLSTNIRRPVPAPAPARHPTGNSHAHPRLCCVTHNQKLELAPTHHLTRRGSLC